MAWNKEDSVKRIKAAVEGLKSIEISSLVRDTDFSNIPLNKAYLVDGTHGYIGITNASQLLTNDGSETEKTHKKYLRFLHLYQRAAHLLFKETDVLKVDFQNERLHFVVYKPYDDEVKRIAIAVAVADLLRQVISTVHDADADLPAAQMCIGIETGKCLVVTNGTKGDREPLFLGNAANHAAKLLCQEGENIFLGQSAWEKVFPSAKIKDPKIPLSAEQIADCVKKAGVTLKVETLVKKWNEALAEHPLAAFDFSRPTPPLSNLDLDALSPQNSRRLECCSIYADVDEFTKFVSDRLANGDAATAVRALHVIRKEMRDVLNDLGGKKVRYIGDCTCGVIAKGTAYETHGEKTVTAAVLAVAAMRSSFRLIKEHVTGISDLGLAIGVEYGSQSITRLGVKGSMDVCVAGVAANRSEEVQASCNGEQTALGPKAFAKATDEVKALFPDGKPVSGITYNEVVAALENEGDRTVAAVTEVVRNPQVVLPRAHCR
jgi:class 3 adenylate cyclase